MDLIKLTEAIVQGLVKDPDSVSIKEFPSEDENVITIQVMVNEEDMGNVIGRQGLIAKSIRTIVQASSYINDNKRVVINIDSY